MPDDDIRELTLRVRVDGNELKVLGADFKKTGDAAQGAGKQAESAGERAKKFFTQLPQAAKAAVGVFLLYKAFAAVKRILSNSVAEAVRYQKSLSLIVGLVGVAREQVAIWGDDLKSLGPRVGKGLGELSDALFFITSAGYRGAEAMEVLEASAKAATAGLGETKNIADLVTSAVNVYGKETLSASDATDILVAGVREGKAEAAEFSTSLGRVIGDANELGVSFDEVTATVASLTRTGINAAESTTQLRAILKGLTRPSKEASDILGEVNLSFADIRRTIQEKGFLAGLQQLGDVVDELGQEKFARLFESTEAYSAIVKLTGEGAAATRATFIALANATGSTDAAFAEAKKNTSFWYDVLKSKLGVVMVDFGTVILPLVTSGVKGLITFISLLSDGVKALANAFSNAFSGIKESIQGSLGFLDKLITSLPRNVSEGALTDISLLVPEGVGGGVDLAAVVAGLRTQAEAEKEVTTAVKEKVKAAKEAISANEELNKSLQSQIKTLQQTAKTSGLTGKEIIEYEKRIEIAKGATEEMAEETAALKRELLGLKEGLEAAKQLDKLDLDILPDSAKLAKARDEILGQLDKVAAAIPERAEEWERKRLAVTAKYAKDITQAQSKELVERLKNSDSFYDQLRGDLLEFRQEAAENGQLMSSFFADTLSEMRNGFSDLFYNVITGKFKSLADVARNTWSAILRSFTQLLAQMATQRLILNIVPNVAGGAAAGGAQGASQLLSSGAGIGGAGGLISRIPGFGAGQTFGGPAIPLGGVGPVQQTPFLASGVANFAGGALGAYNILSSLFKGDIAGGVGAGIGGGIGAAAGSFLPGIGTLVGFGIGSTIGKFLGGFFRKKPRLDIDIEPSEKAAVEDLLKDSFESSISISSRKTGVDKGQLRATVAAALEGQIKQVQAIIDTLPEDVADSLDEALLTTTIDRQEHFGRDRLLEFDKKGKNIQKQLEQFLGGELQARFLFSVRDFFSGAFESLGVLPERARELVDAEFERFKSAGSREDRAAIGQEFLSTFAAAADVYNLVNTNVLDPLTQQLRAAEEAAKAFGFEGIPSLEVVDEKLRELLRDFDDPQALRGLVEFRQGLVALRTELAAGVASFASQIRSTAGQITALGRSIGRDFSGQQEVALRTNIESLGVVLGDATLSNQQRSAVLDEQHSNIQELISLERQRFEESKRAQLATLDIQLEALRKLQTDFTGVFAAAGNTLLQLRTGGDSILSPAERLQTVRDEISGLQGRVPTAQGADFVDIQQRLTQLFPEAVRIAREGFGEGSSVAFAQFAAAEEGLKLVQEQTRQEIVTQQGLVARQNEIAARIEAVNNRQFTVSLETKRLVDVHLSNQVSLLEESQTQQSRMVSELERIGGSLRRIESSLERSLRQPLQVGAR